MPPEHRVEPRNILKAQLATWVSAASPLAIRKFSDAVREARAEDLAYVLGDAVQGVPIEVIGYVVVPVLNERLHRDRELFTLTAQLMTHPGVALDFRGVLLDCLKKSARTRPGLKRIYHRALIDMITNERVPPKLRAKGTRHLADAPTESTSDVLRQHLRSGQPDLVDAAAYVICARRHHRREPNRDIDRLLVAASKALGVRSLKCPSLLAALADSSSGQRALKPIAKTARTVEQRAALVAAAAHGLSPRDLARQIQILRRNRNSRIEVVLRAAFSRRPEMLERLFTGGFRAEYAFMHRLAAAIDTSAGIKRASDALLMSRADAGLPSWVVAIIRRGFDFLPPQDAIAIGYDTGFQIGDALYRNLLLQIGNAEHWHTAIFVGFYTSGDDDRGYAEMLGVNASRGIGWSDAIAFFSAQRWLPRASTDLAGWVNALRGDFLTEFADGHVNHPFHGARSVPAITLQQRQNIVNTATAMYGRNIWWTWVDMLDYKGFGWDGTIDDIDELRCDGVIEYSYEAQGLRVCGGKNPDSRNQWNIARPGSNHPENHNDFHNGDYDPGELCARIQAGDQANDTRFISPVPRRPTVTEFGVTPWFYFLAPIIYFTGDASFSYFVYARILVRKKSTGSFQIVETEDPYGDMGTDNGPWRLRPAYANERVAGFWMGKTQGGPNFRDVDATYEFRLQIVDQGGNVSDEVATEQWIEWPTHT